MHVYLTSSRIPELVTLSRAQQRFVKSQCLFWLFRRLPYRAGSLAITVGCILLASYAADTLKCGIWRSGALAGASVLVLGYLYDMIWIAHWRPEVASFIRLHEAEINTAA